MARKTRIPITREIRDHFMDSAFLLKDQMVPHYPSPAIAPAFELRAEPAHLSWFLRKAPVSIATFDMRNTIDDINTALAVYRRSDDGKSYLFTRLEWIEE